MGKKPVDLTVDGANLIGHMTSVRHPCLSNEEDTAGEAVSKTNDNSKQTERLA